MKRRANLFQVARKLKNLSKVVDFADAISSEMGQVLLEDLERRISELTRNILEGSHQDGDRNALWYLHAMRKDWAEKINHYIYKVAKDMPEKGGNL